jgi:hypothetical protein
MTSVLTLIVLHVTKQVVKYHNEGVPRLPQDEGGLGIGMETRFEAHSPGDARIIRSITAQREPMCTVGKTIWLDSDLVA